jgi:hypothetical protein
MTEELPEVTEATLSLGDELKKAYAEATEETTPDEPQQESQEEEITEEVAEAADEVEEEDEFPLIPKDMSKEEQEHFKSLLESDNEELRVGAEIFLERYNNLKKGFYKKSQEFAQGTKELKEIDNVFEPFKQVMAQGGVSKAQYLKNMVEWEQALHQDPVNAVKKIMKQFNVDAKKLGYTQEYDEYNDDFTNDEDNVILKKLEALEADNKKLKTQIANQPVLTQIENFKNATTAEGKLQHPLFNEVAPLMGSIIQSGKATTLEQAYSMAIRLTDNEAPEQSTTVDLDKIRQKVAKARKAGKGVKTSGAKKDFSQMTIREELQARLNSN